MILLYDASTTKRSEHMVLGVDGTTGNSDGPVPMEMDRVEYKGKSKGGKGKSKDKGGSKGKSKVKSKGKENKRKGKTNDQKGYKGSGNERSKGKGKGDAKTCYVCGKAGHFARDCWQAACESQVRQVTSESGQGSTSATSTHGGMTSVSQQNQQQPVNPQSATQYRVSRICEMSEINDDVQQHEDLVFDMRGLSPTNLHGSVNAVYYYVGDSSDECDDECCFSGAVRTVVENCVASCSDGEIRNILIDSSADASIFPSSVLGKGQPAMGPVGKFVDAQGVQIPILATQDVEVCLRDVTGRTVRLKETVAVSDRVEQPIMCFGHLLQSGRGVDAQQHALVHSTTGTSIPVELQQKSMVVCGTIRAIHEQLTGDEDVYIRAIQAEIDPGVVNGAVGCKLDARGCGAGRHFADRFQDPMLVKPDVSGAFYRTTLVQADGKWYVMELCERLDGLIQLDSEFHEMEGKRNVITFIPDTAKDRRVLRFSLMGDQPQVFPVEPDMEEDADAQIDAVPIEGREIPEGQIVVRPMDEVNVNGTVLTANSSLAALRAGCAFYGVSSSGSKTKCFQRLVDHAKKLELEMVMAASREAQRDQERPPLAPGSAEVPSEFEQAQHRLTHIPYQAWCPSCISHRARADRHERTGESHAGPVPTISFDFSTPSQTGNQRRSSSMTPLQEWWFLTATQVL